MCRSIKTLRRPAPPVAKEEVRAAALQFVRKISGFQKPSRVNETVFEDAVREIAAASERLLGGLHVPPASMRKPAQADQDAGAAPLPLDPANSRKSSIQ